MASITSQPLHSLFTTFLFGQVEDHKPAKVDKWDTIAVKNALDDAAKKVCTFII